MAFDYRRELMTLQIPILLKILATGKTLYILSGYSNILQSRELSDRCLLNLV